jgi:hypothetical protein
MDIDKIFEEMKARHIKSTYRSGNTIWVIEEKGTPRPATPEEQDLHIRLNDILEREDMMAEAMEVAQELRDEEEYGNDDR